LNAVIHKIDKKNDPIAHQKKRTCYHKPQLDGCIITRELQLISTLQNFPENEQERAFSDHFFEKFNERKRLPCSKKIIQWKFLLLNSNIIRVPKLINIIYKRAPIDHNN
jgi:hypothetical protein